jgi:hypothetical protein
MTLTAFKNTDEQLSRALDNAERLLAKGAPGNYDLLVAELYDALLKAQRGLEGLDRRGASRRMAKMSYHARQKMPRARSRRVRTALVAMNLLLAAVFIALVTTPC